VAKFTRLGHSTESIKAVGITNQRETTVVWDTKTGKALHNAVVWTDTRAASIVRDLKFRLNGSDRLTQKCGLPLSTYPSATKLLWLLQNDSTTRECFDRGDLAFGTIDTWLVYKLNGIENNVFVSDASNASRTMFMDLRTLQYSNELLDFFSTGDLDLKRVHMPAIVPSSHPTAFGRINDGVLRGYAVTSCLGDQSAALVGQKGLQPGDAKNTYGTGCFLLYNVGDVPAISSHGLLATVAYHFGDKPVFALEGSIAVAGSGVKFLMENMGFAHTSAHITDLAESVEDNGGLIFVTAFSGLFAPYWIDDTQGMQFRQLPDPKLT
jgi:glycerol kinase